VSAISLIKFYHHHTFWSEFRETERIVPLSETAKLY
jgi:hypothetical protein